MQIQTLQCLVLLAVHPQKAQSNLRWWMLFSYFFPVYFKHSQKGLQEKCFTFLKKSKQILLNVARGSGNMQWRGGGVFVWTFSSSST